MSRKWFENSVPNDFDLNSIEIKHIAETTIDNYHKFFNIFKLELACNEILNFAISANLYLNNKQPWTLIKDSNNTKLVKNIIYNVLESNRIIGLLLKPLLPDLSQKILNQIGELHVNKLSWLEQLQWGLLPMAHPLPKPSPVINKLEYEKETN